MNILPRCDAKGVNRRQNVDSTHFPGDHPLNFIRKFLLRPVMAVFDSPFHGGKFFIRQEIKMGGPLVC